MPPKNKLSIFFLVSVAVGLITGQSALFFCRLFLLKNSQWEEDSYTPTLQIDPDQFTADVVLAHCNKNISWLENATRNIASVGQNVHNIFVYTMCGVDPLVALSEDFQSTYKIQVKKLPNRGRNDMAFAYHIVSNYHKLEKVMFVYFTKDSMHDYPIDFLRALSVPFKEASKMMNFGNPFVCFRRPEATGMEWHRRQEVWKFRLPFYATADNFGKVEADKNFHKENFTMCRFFLDTLDSDTFHDISRHDFIKVCYGGSFAARTSQIRKVPLKAWERIFRKLQAHENGEVMHFMERTWASLLSPPSNSSVMVANRSLDSYPYLPFHDSDGRSYPGGMQLVHGGKERPLETARAEETPQRRSSCILLVSHELTRTGAPLYLLHIAVSFIESGEKVILISPSDGSLSKDFRNAGVQVVICEMMHLEPQRWPCSNTFCPSPTDLILCYVHSKTGTRPDIVLWNTIVWADILLLSHRSRYCHNSSRNIWILHEWVLDGAKNWQHIQALSSESNWRKTVLGVDAMVFCSEMARSQWWKFDGLVPFHTIRGFSVYNDKHGVAQRSVTRSSFGIPSDSFVVTSVGTLCARKQQHWAIDAVTELRSKGIDAILLLIGDTEIEKDFVIQQVLPKQNSLGGDVIRVIQPQDDVSPFLLLADLHTSSSKEESYPINTLEAMALSIPVIATRAGGTEEQFPLEAEWMTSPIDHDVFIGKVVRAATTHNLTDYGRLLSQWNSKNKDDFKSKALSLLQNVRKSRQDNLKCGLLVDCVKNGDDEVAKWESFESLSSEEKIGGEHP
mmetsp:Transcript_7546/g.21032  ORF Transcript_7546/g.21032 Transcript_7546/m.21032 type:complete len:789 (-) Transcript_7546:548-2914(-)